MSQTVLGFAKIPSSAIKIKDTNMNSHQMNNLLSVLILKLCQNVTLSLS